MSAGIHILHLNLPHQSADALIWKNTVAHRNFQAVALLADTKSILLNLHSPDRRRIVGAERLKIAAIHTNKGAEPF